MSLAATLLELDAAGRFLRPVNPHYAFSKVLRGDARWVHSEAVEPHREYGTIMRDHEVSLARPEPQATRLLNADGQYIATIPHWAAVGYLQQRQVHAVGVVAEWGPRVVICPGPLGPAEVHKVRRVLSSGVARAAWDRGGLRRAIELAMDAGADMEDVEEFIALHGAAYVGPAESHRVIGDLHVMRREMNRVELRDAPDFAGIRERLRDRERRSRAGHQIRGTQA